MFSLHVPEPGSLVVPRAAAISELDCRDLFSDDDKASLIPLVLQRSGNTGQLVVSLKGVILSPELECDVLFQRENENLNLAVAHGMGSFYNELFNHTGTVDEVCFEDGENTCPLVMVLIPKLSAAEAERLSMISNMSTLDAIKTEFDPTSLREFRGEFTVGVPSDESTFLNVPLVGHVCCSLMTCDRTELSFDECEPNLTYVREFSVWNRSEIRLAFRVELSDTDGQLELWNYDTNDSLMGMEAEVPAYDHRRIRVIYKPLEVGEFDFQLYVENVNNPNNAITIDISTVVSLESREKLLRVTMPDGDPIPEGVLTMGDCYYGVAAKRTLRVLNCTKRVVDVLLRSDRPGEVSFGLATVDDISKKSNITSPETGVGTETRRLDNREVLESAEEEVDSEVEEESDDEMFANASKGDALRVRRGVHEKNRRVAEDDDSDEEAPSEEDEFEDDDRADGGRARPRSSVADLQQRNSMAVFASPTKTKSKISDESPIRPRPSRNLLVASSPNTSDLGLATQRIEELSLAPNQEVLLIVRLCARLPDSSVPEDDSRIGSLRVLPFKLLFTSAARGIDHWGQSAAGTPAGLRFGDGGLDDHDGGDDEERQQQYLQSEGVGTLPWRYAVSCRARVVASLISVSPNVLDLGDCNIGEYRALTVSVTNNSDLPALVAPQVTSKVVSCSEEELRIPARGFVDLKVEFVPRKVNSNYRKIICFVNRLDKNGGAEVEVRACNVDTHHVLHHSAFYKLSSTSGNGFKQLQVFFNQAIVNCPAVRSFRVENISDKPLDLELMPSLDDIELFTPGREPAEPISDSTPVQSLQPLVPTASSLEESRQSFLESMTWNQTSGGATTSKSQYKENMLSMARDQSNHSQRLRGMDLASVSAPRPQAMSGGSNRRRPQNQRRREIAAVSAEVTSAPQQKEVWTVAQLLAKFEEPLPMEADREGEEKEEAAVRARKSRIEELDVAIAEGRLQAVKHLRIPVGAQATVVVKLTSRGTGSAEESQVAQLANYEVNIRLLDNLDAVSGDQARGAGAADAGQLAPFSKQLIPARALLVRAKVVRSEMSIGQKNITFGRINVGGYATNYVTIVNRSSVPLLYSMQKSASITSGFLQVPNQRRGIIRPHGSREVMLGLSPALAGKFEETLVVANVQDPTNSQVITIKAKVVRPETFVFDVLGDTGSSDSLDFGTLLVGEKSPAIQFSLRNISARRRRFLVKASNISVVHEGESMKLEDKGVTASFYFLFHGGTTAGLPPEQRALLEEKLEKYERKLKIAQRKNNTVKIKGLKAKIARVKLQIEGKAEVDDAALTESESDRSDSETESTRSRILKTRRAQTNHSTSLELDENGTGVITVAFVVYPIGTTPVAWSKSAHLTGLLSVFEEKNEDVKKEIDFRSELFSVLADFDDAQPDAISPENDSQVVRVPGVVPPAPVPSLQAGEGSLVSTEDGFKLFVMAGVGESACLVTDYPELRFPFLNSYSEAVRVSADTRDSTKPLAVVRLTSQVDYDIQLQLKWESAVGMGSDGEESACPWRNENGSIFMLEVDEPVVAGGADFPQIPDGSVTCSIASRASIEIRMLWLHSDSISVNNVVFGGMLSATPVLPTLDRRKRQHIPLIVCPRRYSFMVPSKLDLGRQDLGSTVTATLPITNNALEERTFLVIPMNDKSSTARLEVSDSMAALGPGASRDVTLTLTANELGRFNSTVLLRDLSPTGSTDQKVVVSMNVATTEERIKEFVSFPDLVGRTGETEPINLGCCYMPPLTTMLPEGLDAPLSIAHPERDTLRVTNLTSQPIMLSAVANLKRQCCVYRDRECREDADSVPLAPHSTISLYIMLRPMLPKKSYVSGECRELVGGIRVSGAGSGGKKLFEKTVKFVGVAGFSLLQLRAKSDTLLRGSLPAGRAVEKVWGSFEIRNVAKALPLKYRFLNQNCVTSLSELTRLTEALSSGDADLFVVAEKEFGVLQPEEAKVFTFCFATTTGSDLFSHTVEVLNESCPPDEDGGLATSSLTFRALVEDGSLSLLRADSAKDNGASFIALGTGYGVGDEAFAADTIVVHEPLLVRPLDQPVLSVESARGANKSLLFKPFYTAAPESAPRISSIFTVKSNRAVSSVLRLYCDVPIEVGPVGTLGSARNPVHNVPESYYAVGDPIEIPPGASIDLEMSFLRESLVYFEAKSKPGSAIRFHGHLVFVNSSFDMVGSTGKLEGSAVAKMVSVVGSFVQTRMSLATPKFVDVGRIGAETSRLASTVIVNNDSEAPLPFTVEPREQHALTRYRQDGGSEWNEFGNLLWIPPKAQTSLEVEAVFNVEAEPDVDEGDVHEVKYELGLCVTNASNMRESVDIEIVGESIVKLLSLTDHMRNSVEDGLVLPTLIVSTHADASSAMNSTAWFSVKNTYSQPVQVFLQARPVEALVDTIRLVLVARESNAPIKAFSLEPKETINVRIIQTSLPSARLNQSTIDALEPFGDESEDAENVGDSALPSVLGSLVFEATPIVHRLNVHETDDPAAESVAALSSLLPPSEQLEASASPQVWVTSSLTLGGVLRPGTTFALSTTALQFQLEPILEGGNASAGGMRVVETTDESFTVSNPSATRPLNFLIQSSASRQPGARFHLRERGGGDIVSDTLEPVPSMTSGVVPPGASVDIAVALQAGTTLGQRNKNFAAFADGHADTEVGTSFAAYLIVHDADMPKLSSQSIAVGIVETAPYVAPPADEVDKPAMVGAATVVQEKQTVPAMVEPADSVSNRNAYVKDIVVLPETTPRLKVPPKLPLLAPSSALTTPAELPVLTLRGCTPVPERAAANSESGGVKRFEVNIGQKIKQQISVEWEVTLSNRSGTISVPYKFTVLHQDSGQWTRVGRDSGIVRPGETHDIMLYFARRHFGVFESWIWVENELNANDLKLIRVSMEVVTEPVTMGGEMLFEVLVAGAPAPNLLDVDGFASNSSFNPAPMEPTPGQTHIDFGDVYEGVPQCQHSMVIRNCAAVPLDFKLDSSLGRHLSFSRSSTVLERIFSVTLERQSYLQVYIFLTPQRNSKNASNYGVESVGSNNGNDSSSSQNGGEESGSSLSNSGMALAEKVFVTCRLVQDYRRTIHLRGTVWPRSLNLFPSTKRTLPNGDNTPEQCRVDAHTGLVQLSFASSSSLLSSSGHSPPSCAFFELRNTSLAPVTCVLKTHAHYFSLAVAHLNAPASGLVEGTKNNAAVESVAGSGGNASATPGALSPASPHAVSSASPPAAAETAKEVVVELLAGAGLQVEVVLSAAALATEIERLGPQQLLSSIGLEEHLTVFTRHRRASEKYHVVLNVQPDRHLSSAAGAASSSSGGSLPVEAPMVQFPSRSQPSSSNRHSYAFQALEEYALWFVHKFSGFWHRIEELLPVFLFDGSLDTEHADDSYTDGVGVLRVDSALIELRSQFALASGDHGDSSPSTRSTAITTTATSTSSNGYGALLHELQYLVDELIFFVHREADTSGVIGQRLGFKLATLVFGFVLRQRTLTRVLDRSLLSAWTTELDRFLSFVPMQSPSTEVLFELHRSLIAQPLPERQRSSPSNLASGTAALLNAPPRD